MTRSDRNRRIGLTALYIALTMWAQAGDHHGHSSSLEVACDAACRDPRPHYSGHPTPALDRDAGDCLACQSRAQLGAILPEAPALGGSVAEPVRLIATLAPILRVAGIPSSRGPPSA